MLILSRKKDYYDGVVGTMGIDKTLVYKREPLEIVEKQLPEIFKRASYNWRKNKNSPFLKIDDHSFIKGYKGKYQASDAFIIGFCGKFYVGWKLSYEIDVQYGKKLITDIGYDFETIKTFFTENNYSGSLTDDYNYITNYKSLDLFREFNAPVFVYDTYHNRTSIGRYFDSGNHPKLIINPTLNDYQFYKVLDSFQAFQEISMFMGGVLGRGEKEIVEVQDKYKITQHGFDKWSFRKEPKNR